MRDYACGGVGGAGTCRRFTFVRCILPSAFCLLLLGCGSGRPETVPVSGRVTLGGGDWPAAGLIVFTPVEPAEGFPRRAGRAFFDTQGHFTVMTYTRGDGLMPGRYRAAVYCGEPVDDMDAEAKSFVPLQYQNPARSGLELVVESGGRRMYVEYDIPPAP